MLQGHNEAAVPRTKIKVVGWAILILGSLVLVFVCLEIMTRIVFPNGFVVLDIVENTSDARNYALKANSKAYHFGVYEELPVPIRWEVNEQGMRSDQPLNPRKDKFRIMTFGDSETFGWSVQLEDTMQRQMEAIDSNVEVLNLGVPGYNAKNVADYMEMAVEEYDPDAIVYIFNPNDSDAALTISPTLSKSVSYLLVRYMLYVNSGKQGKAWEVSSEARLYIALQLTRMMKVCKQQNVPLIIVVLGWENPDALPFPWQEYSEESLYLPGEQIGAFYVSVIDARGMFLSSERKDRHLAAPAHRKLAGLLCQAISGVDRNVCRR